MHYNSDFLGRSISRLNKKLNYLISDLKPEFIDPFEAIDEQIIFDGIMELTDGQGRDWKLVRKSTIERFRNAIRHKEEECKKIPAFKPNVDFANYPNGEKCLLSKT